MSAFRVEVVRLGPVEHHPNADALDVTRVHGGYPCIVRRGEYAEGDLAVYVPVDALVPVDAPRFAFLASRGTRNFLGDGRQRHRVRAMRLRGVFSMGLLVKPGPEWTEGQDVREVLDIVKYEPPEPMTGQEDDEKDPGILPVYDVEGLRRWPDLFLPGEEVVVTEKIDGENARFVWHDGRLHVASRTRFKKLESTTPWNMVARDYELATRLRDCPYAFFGEVFGGGAQNQLYGVQRGRRDLRIFDVLEVATRRWLAFDIAIEVADGYGMPWVPVLWRGAWSNLEAVAPLAEGLTTIGGATHVREGIVIRPTVERFDDRIGRVILKLHGEGGLTRKETTP